MVLKKFLITESEDYIFANLLVGVLLPSTRFKDEHGNCTKTLTIIDGMERFVLHVSSINDYEKEIADCSGKYYSVWTHGAYY